ncbi:transposase family protein [Mesorhizobium sp. M2A.F.Ca.ET.043.05.1.1]|uniref:integrase catalytic domain-containing protein n=1 Tax=Mesorhizobium sp. M2A.F.Ca.ET.043.05.1.1 TaxID=2493671 RepID=UPI0032B2B3CA
MRTFGDWNDPPPGYVEVDFVAHSGTSSSGSFVQAMVLTDIATGWTECVPVRTRESGLVIAAIKRARSLFPFPLQGVDFDNDSAFMNELVVSWCRSQGLEVTRSRAYRKNDQAWVEQKNSAIVRRLVGYGRFVGAEATAALVRLYDAVRLHGNLFQPSFKLREKTRIGARVIKRYHPPAPPVERVLAHPEVPEVDKQLLRAMLATADPVMLFTGIRAAQEDLGRRVDRRGVQATPQEPVVIDLQRFTANLKTAWQGGEVRPTHKRPPAGGPSESAAYMVNDIGNSQRCEAGVRATAACGLTRTVSLLVERFCDLGIDVVLEESIAQFDDAGLRVDLLGRRIWAQGGGRLWIFPHMNLGGSFRRQLDDSDILHDVGKQSLALAVW